MSPQPSDYPSGRAAGAPRRHSRWDPESVTGAPVLRSSTPPSGKAEGVPLIFELGQPGRANRYLEEGKPLETFLPKRLVRDDLPLPDNSELDVVRHYTRLSQRTFGIDLGFYPLGSCTMKYNPRVNDALAARREFANSIHTRPTSWPKVRCV